MMRPGVGLGFVFVIIFSDCPSLPDRMEDVTREEEVEKDPKCDRRITLYGYNRGQAIKNHQAIHIAGKIM